MKSLFRHTNNTRPLIKDSYRYIRSDLPMVVDEDEKQLLIDNNVLTIIDLRSPGEVQMKPCAFVNDSRFTYISMPTTGGPKMPKNMGGSAHDPFAGKPPAGNPMPKEMKEGGMPPMKSKTFYEYADSYVKMTDDNMRNIIRTIENASTGVLYFCGAGKDRTGVVSALLLKRMGKSYEDIILDYVLSAIYDEKMLYSDEQFDPSMSMAANAPNAITIYHYLEAIKDMDI